MKTNILILFLSIFSVHGMAQESRMINGTYSGVSNIFNTQAKTTINVKNNKDVSYKQEWNTQTCGGSLSLMNTVGNTFIFNDLSKTVLNNVYCMPVQGIEVVFDSGNDVKFSATFVNPINNQKVRQTISLKKVLPAPIKLGSPQLKIANLMVELDKYMKPTALDVSWSGKREWWIAQCNQNTTPNQLASSLTDYESNIKWEAVETAWKTRRPTWLKECETATTIAQVANLLTELEKHIKWESVEANWQARRESWITDCKNAKN